MLCHDMTALQKSLPRLVANPLVSVRLEDSAQRRLDVDFQRSTLRLAGAAAERVDGMTSDLGNRVG
jgi:hypothetical protein